MSDLPTAQKEGHASKTLGIFGWIMGAAAGIYSGINLLIPLFATGAVWWVGERLLNDEKKVILPAFSVNAGHCLWLALGVALTGAGALSAVGADLIVYAIGLIWLLLKPSLGSLYLLGIFQLLSVGINGYSFAEATIGSATHKALLVHVIWRAMSLFFMLKLFLILKKESKTNAAITP